MKVRAEDEENILREQYCAIAYIDPWSQSEIIGLASQTSTDA